MLYFFTEALWTDCAPPLLARDAGGRDSRGDPRDERRREDERRRPEVDRKRSIDDRLQGRGGQRSAPEGSDRGGRDEKPGEQQQQRGGGGRRRSVTSKSNNNRCVCASVCSCAYMRICGYDCEVQKDQGYVL